MTPVQCFFEVKSDSLEGGYMESGHGRNKKYQNIFKHVFEEIWNCNSIHF